MSLKMIIADQEPVLFYNIISIFNTAMYIGRTITGDWSEDLDLQWK